MPRYGKDERVVLVEITGELERHDEIPLRPFKRQEVHRSKAIMVMEGQTERPDRSAVIVGDRATGDGVDSRSCTPRAAWMIAAATGNPNIERGASDLWNAHDRQRTRRHRTLTREAASTVRGPHDSRVRHLYRGGPVSCHHNYVARERHGGQELYVTSQGVLRAGRGKLGIIPGPMRTRSYLVSRLGSLDSFDPPAHGADRRMPRAQAKAAFDEDDARIETEGRRVPQGRWRRPRASRGRQGHQRSDGESARPRRDLGNSQATCRGRGLTQAYERNGIRAQRTDPGRRPRRHSGHADR